MSYKVLVAIDSTGLSELVPKSLARQLAPDQTEVLVLRCRSSPKKILISRRLTKKGWAEDTMSAVLVFSYGNLQYRDVQIATFGHELAGRKDSLPGYHRQITEVGRVSYYNIEASSDPEDVVSGTLFEITEQDLAAADKYEKSREYRRTVVTLRSGVQAWVYCRV